MKKNTRLIVSIVLIISLSLLLFSCSSNDEGDYYQGEGSMDYDRAAEAPMSDDSYEGSGLDSPSLTSGSVSGDKIIYRQSLTMETDNLQQTVSKMEQDLDRYGGHIFRYQVISEKDESPRGDFTLRVPSGSLKDFVEALRNYGIFTQEVLESDDVSETFYDLEANLRNQTIQERRLLDLLEEAENLSDILILESELSRIRREIEHLKGYLNRLDDQVQYSTVYLAIQEVDNLELEGGEFGDQFRENFKNSFRKFQSALESTLLWLASYFPFVILVGILLALIGKFYPRFFKKLKRKDSSKIQE